MKNIRTLGIVAVVTLLEIGSLLFPSFSHAANLTAAKDTLQSSRMSFNGRVKSPTVAGSSHVWIYTVASVNATSITTANLKPGDSLTIGANTGYIIDSIVDDDEFTITTTLTAGDADDTDVIYMLSKPQHVITFTTASAINGGFFRVLIPAASSTSNDGIPDTTGFDTAIASVTATATNTTGYTFTTPVATPSGTGACTSPTDYHCFEFHYTGAGGVATPITLTIGNTGGTANLVSPAANIARTANQADSYTFIVENYPNLSNPNTVTATDLVRGKIAVIEAVRVTATVDPSITFKIEGVNISTSACSLTTSVTTSATAVPFGSLTIDTFKIAAQKLTVSTNATAGYAVTAINNERMSNLASSPSYIEGTTCDTGTCTHNGTSAAWATAAAHSGLGYTVAIVTSTPTIAPISPLYQHFPSAAASEPPFQIMANNAVSSTHAAYVCYKIAVAATQPAGDYENQVTYTATATF